MSTLAPLWGCLALRPASSIVGDLIQEAYVAKIADDLYVGGNSPEEVLHNWRHILSLLQQNNLPLSASKTFICPKKATVLGWVWSNGTLQASPHKLAALSSCASVNSARLTVLCRCIQGAQPRLAKIHRAA